MSEYLIRVTVIYRKTVSTKTRHKQTKYLRSVTRIYRKTISSKLGSNNQNLRSVAEMYRQSIGSKLGLKKAEYLRSDTEI